MSRSRFSEVHAAMVARVAAGASFSDAARQAGVPTPTARGWLTRGRGDPASEHGAFAAAIDTARAAREQTARRPMDRDELRVAVGNAARAGSAQAMKLVWRMHLADRPS